MNPKEKAHQIISDFTSICLMAYHHGGGKDCTCDECHSDGLRQVMNLGRDAALKTAQEIHDSLPVFIISHNEKTYEPEPNNQIEYWQEVIEEIENEIAK